MPWISPAKGFVPSPPKSWHVGRRQQQRLDGDQPVAAPRARRFHRVRGIGRQERTAAPSRQRGIVSPAAGPAAAVAAAPTRTGTHPGPAAAEASFARTEVARAAGPAGHESTALGATVSAVATPTVRKQSAAAARPGGVFTAAAPGRAAGRPAAAVAAAVGAVQRGHSGRCCRVSRAAAARDHQRHRVGLRAADHEAAAAARVVAARLADQHQQLLADGQGDVTLDHRAQSAGRIRPVAGVGAALRAGRGDPVLASVRGGIRDDLAGFLEGGRLGRRRAERAAQAEDGDEEPAGGGAAKRKAGFHDEKGKNDG